MRTIKNLMVKVTYTVGLGEVEVENEEYESLMRAYNDGGEVPNPDECCCGNGKQALSPASEWLSENIKEGDAMDWEYEIECFEEQ